MNGGPTYSRFLSFSQTFGYDNANRLTWANDTGGWSRNFGYDPYGNMWVAATGNTGVILAGNTPTSQSQFTSNNQIAGNAYDAAGNLLSVNGNTANYDAENQLVQVTEAPAGGGGIENLAYDGFGRRVEKLLPSAMSVYVYDAFGLLAASYSSAASPAQCKTCYLSTDHLGSVRLVTDQSGSVVARHDYLPFGEEIPANTAERNGPWGSTVDVVHKFTGKERDQETGLDYFGARYYESALGRFTSPDPFAITQGRITDPQQLNLYAYVRNNPLALTDPTGMIIDYSDLSDKDKKLWHKIEDLAGQADANGNLLHPELAAAYNALSSDTRVFKIEDNPKLGSQVGGQFTITKFDGKNDFSEGRIDLNFNAIKNALPKRGDFDASFQKFAGLEGNQNYPARVAETFGHEANHAIFAENDPAQGTEIQRLVNAQNAAVSGIRYPYPPDVMQKIDAAQRALIPTEKYAQQAEKIINGELRSTAK